MNTISNNQTEKISNNDVIFARAMVMGREALNLRLSGIDSMATLLSILREHLGTALGIVNLTIRNMSQGWSTSRHLLLRA